MPTTDSTEAAQTVARPTRIALLIPFEADSARGPVAYTIRKAAELQGARVTTVVLNASKPYLDLLADWLAPSHFDGAIIVANASHFGPQNRSVAAALQRLSDVRIPFICLGASLAGACAWHEDVPEGAGRLFDHLIEEHGRRRIACLFSSSPDGQESNAIAQILQQRLAARGLRFDASLLHWNCRDPNDVARAIDGLIASGEEAPDALFVRHGYRVSDACQALEERGLRVPRDVSVAGGQLPTYSRFWPWDPTALAAVPSVEVGVEALHALLRWIRDGLRPDDRRIEVPIVLGETCGCPGGRPQPLPADNADSMLTHLRRHREDWSAVLRDAWHATLPSFDRRDEDVPDGVLLDLLTDALEDPQERFVRRLKQTILRHPQPVLRIHGWVALLKALSDRVPALPSRWPDWSRTCEMVQDALRTTSLLAWRFAVGRERAQAENPISIGSGEKVRRFGRAMRGACQGLDRTSSTDWTAKQLQEWGLQAFAAARWDDQGGSAEGVLLMAARGGEALELGLSGEPFNMRRMLHDLPYPQTVGHRRISCTYVNGQPCVLAMDLSTEDWTDYWRAEQVLTYVLDVVELHAVVQEQAARLASHNRELLAEVESNAAAMRDLAWRATHDPLTGLPNRALYVDRLEQAYKRLLRQPDENFAVIFVDLDDFKPINDLHGHAAGDLALQELGRRLQECVRSGDTIARVGGDEFAALVEGVHRRQELMAIAERIREVVARPIEIKHWSLRATASIGVAVGQGNGAVPERLLEDADAAMYQAKAEGGNRIHCCEMEASGSGRFTNEDAFCTD